MTVDCPYCRGSGDGRQIDVAEWLACPYCGGRGWVFPDDYSETRCDWCDGYLTMAELAEGTTCLVCGAPGDDPCAACVSVAIAETEGRV
jgi:DnaJ-class molecular chaperone